MTGDLRRIKVVGFFNRDPMAIFELNRKQRQKLRIFSVCVVLSFFVWVLFAMANKYTYHIHIPLRYVNAPDNKAFSPLQSDTVNMEVEGSGWQILFSRLSLPANTLRVDLSSLKNRNWVVFSTQLDFINEQFDRNQQVVSIAPDTLYFDFSKQTIKKVPVLLESELQFKPQYGVVDSVQLEPSMVTVTGPQEDIANITTWRTNKVTRQAVDRSIETKVSLRANERANISIYPAQVDVRIPVGEITEKVLEIPVRVIHGAEYSGVMLVPAKVKIKVMVSLRNYAQITRESFDAVVDLDTWKEYGADDLPVVLSKVPDFCTIKQIIPQNVNFIINP